MSGRVFEAFHNLPVVLVAVRTMWNYDLFWNEALTWNCSTFFFIEIMVYSKMKHLKYIELLKKYFYWNYDLFWN